MTFNTKQSSGRYNMIYLAKGVMAARSELNTRIIYKWYDILYASVYFAGACFSWWWLINYIIYYVEGWDDMSTVALSFHSLAGIVLLFPSIALTVGMVLNIFNRTIISLDGDSLRMEYDPFPAGRSVLLPKRDVASVWVSHFIQNDTNPRWHVYVELNNGRNVRIAKWLTSEDQANAIKCEIDNWLASEVGEKEELGEEEN